MKRVIACFVFVVVFVLPASAAKMVIQQTLGTQPRGMAISPNGKFLAVGNYDGPI